MIVCTYCTKRREENRSDLNIAFLNLKISQKSTAEWSCDLFIVSLNKDFIQVSYRQLWSNSISIPHNMILLWKKKLTCQASVYQEITFYHSGVFLDLLAWFTGIFSILLLQEHSYCFLFFLEFVILV